MHVTLLYTDDCPNWRLTAERLREALQRVGRADATVEHRRVTTPEDAASTCFHGSPTVLVDGRDPFADLDDPVGLSCRVYRTGTGLSGAPTVDQLAACLR